jgi:hypothetical protein
MGYSRLAGEFEAVGGASAVKSAPNENAAGGEFDPFAAASAAAVPTVAVASAPLSNPSAVSAAAAAPVAAATGTYSLPLRVTFCCSSVRRSVSPAFCVSCLVSPVCNSWCCTGQG